MRRRPGLHLPPGIAAAVSRAGRRAGHRRASLLPLFALPLLPAAFMALLFGRGHALGGLVAAGFIAWAAGRVLRRGRPGGARRAAILMGVAAGVAALVGAQLGTIGAAVLAALAWGGTRLLLDGVDAAESEANAEAEATRVEAARAEATRAEAAARAAAAPPEPAMPAVLRDATARLARIEAAAAGLRDSRLLAASQAMGEVVAELLLRPERLPAARRFLTVQLEGLERVTAGLSAGATPPSGLPRLLDDMRDAADRLRQDMRRAADEELDIQVRVLSARLREEGYA
ncbi:hypothetical protein C8P66_101254 [Humitalea rosea]|uniref:5-bromo-4-chloroindolyl phosphate hydrolysis protein n=1 Tax=Humitalea rosea TaxID=990373 RepID=A0A2W7JEX8_9PROT|nr:hypothetical protein [Humitalea rosea]PZW51037.1 hypothetical protein C8P66_101254 [Humitalea rosea]